MPAPQHVHQLAQKGRRLMARTIKPEYWNGEDFTLPRLVYAGEMLQPKEMQSLAPMYATTSFVYHVFDRDGALGYVGFTGSPYSRWSIHRLKATWWDKAHYLNLYAVQGRDRLTADLGARHWESVAIRGALPLFNLHGPANLPAKAVRS